MNRRAVDESIAAAAAAAAATTTTTTTTTYHIIVQYVPVDRPILRSSGSCLGYRQAPRRNTFQHTVLLPSTQVLDRLKPYR